MMPLLHCEFSTFEGMQRRGYKKHSLRELLHASLLGCLVAVSGAGCTTTQSTRAETLKPTTGADVDLSQYQIATVLSFEPVAGAEMDPLIGPAFSDAVANRLRTDFGPIFKDVRRAQPLGQADELIVAGTIRKYRRGSKFARAMLIGLGSASFEGEMSLKDGVDGRVLYAAPFDKLWAWGGIAGMSKGIEDMVAETEAMVAATIARAKGWQPPPEASKAD